MIRLNNHTRKSPTSVNGFTLIELLVVIAIIAILAAILFPVFAQAKESAKKANCINNLKNIATATLLYATDYDDRTFFGQGPGFNLVDGTQYWWGFVSTSLQVDYSRGVIGPYLKNGPVEDCPCAADMPPNGFLGTANAAGNVPVGVIAFANSNASPDLSQFELPAETLMFYDAGGLLYPSKIVHRWSFTPVLFIQNGMHARHGGDFAVMSWFDSHVKAAKIQYRPFDSQDSAQGGLFGTLRVPQAAMKEAKIGDMLKFPRATTGLMPGGVTAIGTNTGCDWWYYQNTKPKPCP